MGYAATTTVVYGIELEDSRILHFLNDLEHVLILSGCPDFDITRTNWVTLMGLCQTYLGLSEFVMRADAADSRVESCSWFNAKARGRTDYALGFDLGSKGYGADDDLVKIIRSDVPEKIQQQWKCIMAPMLKCSAVLKTATMHTVEQMH